MSIGELELLASFSYSLAMIHTKQAEREKQNKKPLRSPSDLYATANFLSEAPILFSTTSTKKNIYKKLCTYEVYSFS